MQLFSDLDILALPSVPGRRMQAAFSGSRISGSTSVAAVHRVELVDDFARLLDHRLLSSPAGTVVARKAVMSDACEMG